MGGGVAAVKCECGHASFFHAQEGAGTCCAPGEGERFFCKCQKFTASDRNPSKPKPRAKPVKRWTTKVAADGWTIVPAFDGETVDVSDAVRALNRAGVVLPKARRR